jgi:hypothetical protein
MSPKQISERVASALREGHLSRRRAEALLGFVFLEWELRKAVSLPHGADSPPATYWRRCVQLRTIGLAREGQYLEPVPVDWDVQDGGESIGDSE